ncbi:tRNA-dihydrouridine synthase 3 [Sporothrix bragantina]|uniref:tRNA-dihydrouridine(47) synthase [NAD(P)(+)] n=1 Tax=Sporothrix bragantina TaxID=671064 RepID=A0ABP0CQV0_9PEZI
MTSEKGASEMQTDTPVAAPGSPVKRSLDTSTTVEAPANGSSSNGQAVAAQADGDSDEHRQKRTKTDGDAEAPAKREKIHGIAMIKEEYLIKGVGNDPRGARAEAEVDDDAAEGRDSRDSRDARDGGGGGGRKNRKKGGQNKDRDFGRSRDAQKLCASVSHSPEFSPKFCRYGENCRALHDLRKYLYGGGRRGDLETFEGKCPVFAVYGRCPSGWKCRFVSSHMKEVEHEDGRKELVLLGEAEAKSGDANGENGADGNAYAEDDDARPGVVNVVSSTDKQNLTRRRFDLSRSEQYIKWLDKELNIVKKIYNNKKKEEDPVPAPVEEQTETKETTETTTKATEAPAAATTAEETATPATTTEPAKPEADAYISPEEHRAQFVDPPFLPSEKRRIYFGPETPTLAPLTTQGNLPFRRLCVELGCEVTYSEMALGVDMVAGKQPEWALMKAHASEINPPRFSPSPNVSRNTVVDYDNSRDLKFGAQIAANQPWMAIKATEAMTRLLPHLRLVDMNCGCPIDLIYKTGGGSGLLESHNKLERMIRGMNAVSGEVPITAKIRIGVRDNSPCAPKVIEHLAFGGPETRERIGAPGCAAITLHGRTRNQRYKKPADWSYIAECAELVKSYNAQRDALADTVREPDARTQANTAGKGAGSDSTHIFFLGNGDCYSHVQYQEQIAQSGVDAVMIGRGAIIKPWLFEEIQTGQYLDKSASERLAYVERFAKYGMEAWGTDEYGLGTTRRFLLEYLSFATRYVPIGLLEYLPPSLNDRPPAFRGRNDLETLLSSRNYKDWIKISEMFLGPAHPEFKFVPKHKSNAYEIEAEG